MTPSRREAHRIHEWVVQRWLRVGLRDERGEFRLRL